MAKVLFPENEQEEEDRNQDDDEDNDKYSEVDQIWEGVDTMNTTTTNRASSRSTHHETTSAMRPRNGTLLHQSSLQTRHYPSRPHYAFQDEDLAKMSEPLSIQARRKALGDAAAEEEEDYEDEENHVSSSEEDDLVYYQPSHGRPTTTTTALLTVSPNDASNSTNDNQGDEENELDPFEQVLGMRPRRPASRRGSGTAKSSTSGASSTAVTNKTYGNPCHAILPTPNFAELFRVFEKPTASDGTASTNNSTAAGGGLPSVRSQASKWSTARRADVDSHPTKPDIQQSQATNETKPPSNEKQGQVSSSSLPHSLSSSMVSRMFSGCRPSVPPPPPPPPPPLPAGPALLRHESLAMTEHSINSSTSTEIISNTTAKRNNNNNTHGAMMTVGASVPTTAQVQVLHREIEALKTIMQQDSIKLVTLQSQLETSQQNEAQLRHALEQTQQQQQPQDGESDKPLTTSSLNNNKNTPVLPNAIVSGWNSRRALDSLHEDVGLLLQGNNKDPSLIDHMDDNEEQEIEFVSSESITQIREQDIFSSLEQTNHNDDDEDDDLTNEQEEYYLHQLMQENAQLKARVRDLEQSSSVVLEVEVQQKDEPIQDGGKSPPTSVAANNCAAMEAAENKSTQEDGENAMVKKTAPEEVRTNQTDPSCGALQQGRDGVTAWPLSSSLQSLVHSLEQRLRTVEDENQKVRKLLLQQGQASFDTNEETRATDQPEDEMEVNEMQSLNHDWQLKDIPEGSQEDADDKDNADNESGAECIEVVQMGPLAHETNNKESEHSSEAGDCADTLSSSVWDPLCDCWAPKSTTTLEEQEANSNPTNQVAILPQNMGSRDSENPSPEPLESQVVETWQCRPRRRPALFPIP